MQKRLLFFLGFLGTMIFAQAQIERPVTWKFSTTPGENGQVLVQFTATIDDGWHLYSQFIEDGGPIPTGFYFDDAVGYKTVGKVKELGSIHKGYDETFEMELAYFDKKVTFSQAVTVDGAEATVSGYLEYMVCNDEKCLPPTTEDFSMVVKAPVKPEQKIEEKPAPEPAKAETAKPDPAPASEASATPGTEPATSPIPSLFPGASQIKDPVSWTFDVREIEGGMHELVLLAKVQDGWKIYSQFIEEGGPIPTSFTFQEGKFDLVGEVSEIGEKHEGFDDIFKMDVSYLHGEIEFIQKVKFHEGVVPVFGDLAYMTCDSSQCLPAALEFSIGGELEKAILSAEGLLENLVMANLDLTSPVSNCTEAEESGISAWKDFLAGFLGGLFALFTPCVFPMIPLTVSFFTKSSSDRKRGIANALIYGMSILGVYMIASVPFHLIEGIEGNVFNVIATDPRLNLGFFIIFVAFAISFFGYYDISLPSGIANRANSASGMGNIAGIFFMGLTLCIVSFSCTGPILGSLMAVSASGSVSAWNLTAAMAGFGLALALPFGLFAAFPSWLNSLPKSGSWLTTVKVVLGFIELALAVKFLSNADLVQHWGIVKRETFFLLWIIIGIAMILYLLGKIKFPHDAPVKKIAPTRWGFIAVIAAFVVYLIPGLFNNESANRSLLSGFPPPMFYSWYEKDSNCPLDLPCYKDYEEGLAIAKATGKPVMLDFTGWACTNCRRMEENVWVDPAVFKKLSEDYVLISLYVDDRKELPKEQQGKIKMSTGSERRLRTVGDKWAVFQEENFHHNTQPLYALITAEGELLNQPVAYTPDEEEYLDFLQCGLDAYAEKQAMK